ncbi:MAG: excinuclease ABC subunit UvrC [Bacilli bacterium]|nr:excinuclease ABC subunit UvrC [Bacilli bacterium]MDD4733819.1 excinuclease ABC subunit UvrC [Bacilli bacterium]
MFKGKLSLVPTKPGCYQMKNSDGIIIYVGKAKNLKNRLTSYFTGTHNYKTLKLVSEIKDFEYVVVSTEAEALILELNLIKKYDPKYNILLRDDKSYPYIELTKEKVPRLKIVRNLNRKRNKTSLYGPYPNVTSARKTVNLLNRIYPLRKCKTYPKKPCLYYHIGQCLGYCVNNIENNIIEEMNNEIIKFLKGDETLVADKLKNEMNVASEKMNYERALELKGLLDDISLITSKQKVEIRENADIDVLGYYSDNNYLSIQVFFIRTGKILERHSKIINLVDTIENELTRYIAKFYQTNVILPKELLVPSILSADLLSEHLRITVKSPLKGIKKNIVEMANDNAKITLKEKIELVKKDEQRTIDANNELKELLNLEKLDRIEIFDNSNLFGDFNVSGMVVFINGKEAKNEYRKYKIHIDKNDDYKTMEEVIYRRYFRVLNNNLVKPDLIVVDGGLGQINVALKVLESLNLNIKVVGLKKDKHHNTNTLLTPDPIEIKKNSNLFHYLERMQSEVHNFTINYHKQLRSKGALESILDNIEGIGNVRKNKLLKKYKTITSLKKLSISELETLLPSKVAQQLYVFLHESQ